MTRPTLVIANRNYSSWSLRPWLVMRHFGIAFEEVRVPLHQPDSRSRILRHSPSGKLPVLIDGSLAVWDSLAICEYLAERHARLWPAGSASRARARAVSAEMHSGFQSLRQNMPMNCRAYLPGRGRAAGVAEDIERIQSLWESAREEGRANGPFLFGDFSIADAMYAPVAWRFRTYDVELRPTPRAYVDTLIALPGMQAWLDGARAETETIPQYDAVT